VTEDALTFPDGMRVARYTQRPVSDAEYYERVGDILALTRFASVTADGSHGTAFRRTLEQSATVAVAESTGAGQSTTTLLAETPLVDWAQVDVGAWEADGVDYDRCDEFVGTTGYWGPEGMVQGDARPRGRERAGLLEPRQTDRVGTRCAPRRDQRRVRRGTDRGHPHAVEPRGDDAEPALCGLGGRWPLDGVAPHLLLGWPVRGWRRPRRTR
jgi:hypothetical protein